MESRLRKNTNGRRYASIALLGVLVCSDLAIASESGGLGGFEWTVEVQDPKLATPKVLKPGQMAFKFDLRGGFHCVLGPTTPGNFEGRYKESRELVCDKNSVKTGTDVLCIMPKDGSITLSEMYWKAVLKDADVTVIVTCVGKVK